MTVVVVFSEHAVDDLREARDHYALIDASLGDDFAASAENVIERIRMFPRGAPPVADFPGLRRARLRRFPYGVFYRDAESGSVVVVRVLHSAQNTGDLTAP